MTKEEVFVLSNRLPNRILKGALGAFLTLALAACSENLTGSLGCPELCQDQSALLRDTTLTGVLVVDTVVSGFPLQSAARDFTLLSQGVDGDLRVVFRFDTLGGATFRNPTATVDSAVTKIISPLLHFAVDTSYGRLSAPITIHASDAGVRDVTKIESVGMTVSVVTRYVSLGVYPVPLMRSRSGDVPRMRSPTRSRAPACTFDRTKVESIGICSESVIAIDARVADPMSRSGRKSGTSACVRVSAAVVSTSYASIVIGADSLP